MVSFIPMAFALVFVVQLARPSGRHGVRCPRCGPGCPTRRRPTCAAPGSPPSTWRRWSSVRPRRRSSPPPSPAQFGDNFRTAFLIIMPIAFLGAGCLLLARTPHRARRGQGVRGGRHRHGGEAGRGGGMERRTDGARPTAPRASGGTRRGGGRRRRRGRDVARQGSALPLHVGERPGGSRPPPRCSPCGRRHR